MRKTFAFVLALALICSLGVIAFAEPSASKTSPVAVAAEAIAKKGGWVICKTATDEFVCDVPDEDVTIVAVDKADTLEDADKEAFLAAYEAAKAIEGKTVKDFFWLDVADKYTVDADNYLKYTAIEEGDSVLANGNEMKVAEDDEGFFAKLTELGAIAILCEDVAE